MSIDTPMRFFSTVEEIPLRVAALPRDHRGYPVPFFVHRPSEWKSGSVVDFRIVDPQKFQAAVSKNLCWVCGGMLGAYRAFIGGPLSAAQRVYADPPSHKDCATFALKACPFLAIPTAQRREADLPPVAILSNVVGTNPQVSALLIAGSTTVIRGALLAENVSSVTWYARGRLATRAEVLTAIELAEQRQEVISSTNRKSIVTKMRQLALPH